jgi:hypothetical protein
LQPFDRSAGADFKALGRLTSRRPRFDCFDNSLTQVTRGIVEVAALTASAAGVLPATTITVTWRLTRSAASAGSRSI